MSVQPSSKRCARTRTRVIARGRRTIASTSARERRGARDRAKTNKCRWRARTRRRAGVHGRAVGNAVGVGSLCAMLKGGAVRGRGGLRAEVVPRGRGDRGREMDGARARRDRSAQTRMEVRGTAGGGVEDTSVQWVAWGRGGTSRDLALCVVSSDAVTGVIGLIGRTRFALVDGSQKSKVRRTQLQETEAERAPVCPSLRFAPGTK